MSINIPKTNSLTQVSLTALEHEYGKLPNIYKLFLKQHDGAKPKENVFRINGKIVGGVEQFIPASRIIKVRNKVEGFSKHMLPFAKSAGGNFLYLDPLRGSVYFWNHELEDEDIKVANSFSEFLGMLEDFDVDQIKLIPGQVKKVWIDPNFKPRF